MAAILYRAVKRGAYQSRHLMMALSMVVSGMYFATCELKWNAKRSQLTDAALDLGSLVISLSQAGIPFDFYRTTIMGARGHRVDMPIQPTPPPWW